MTTIIEEPGQHALHLPALLDDLEPLPCPLYELQVNLMCLFHTTDPVAQPLGLIAAVAVLMLETPSLNGV